MHFLLRLRHWQLFAITWMAPVAMNVISFNDPVLLIKGFPIMMVFFAVGTLGWIRAIATGLSNQLPDAVKLNVGVFKVLFAIPIFYLLLFLVSSPFLMEDSADPIIDGTTMVAIIVPLHLTSMVITLWGVRFAAKTLKSVELGRKAKFQDYAGEFFLIWMNFIGFWILQPRINKMVQDDITTVSNGIEEDEGLNA